MGPAPCSCCHGKLLPITSQFLHSQSHPISLAPVFLPPLTSSPIAQRRCIEIQIPDLCLVQTAPYLHRCDPMSKLTSCSSAAYLQISVCLAVKVNGLKAAYSGSPGGNQDTSSNTEVQDCSPGLSSTPACDQKILQVTSLLEFSRLR